ncbi:hypothetical protein BKA80DRAFT_77321 [Phyllosticta citrichinensis]
MPGLSPTGFGNTTTAAFSSFSRKPGAQVSTNRLHNLYGSVSSIGPGKAKKRKTLSGVLGLDDLYTLRLSLIKILSLGSTQNYWCVLFEQSPVVCGRSKSLCGRENQHVHHLEKSPAGCYNNKKYFLSSPNPHHKNSIRRLRSFFLETCIQSRRL